jgi:hypothetical protein
VSQYTQTGDSSKSVNKCIPGNMAVNKSGCCFSSRVPDYVSVYTWIHTVCCSNLGYPDSSDRLGLHAWQLPNSPDNFLLISYLLLASSPLAYPSSDPVWTIHFPAPSLQP